MTAPSAIWLPVTATAANLARSLSSELVEDMANFSLIEIHMKDSAERRDLLAMSF